MQEKSIGDVIAAYANDAQLVENGWSTLQKSIGASTDLSKALLEGSGAAPEAATQTPAPSADASTIDAGAAAASAIEQTPHALAALSAELDKQLKETDALRAKAIDLLNSALKNYETAGSTAQTMTGTLNQRISSPDSAKLPEHRAWMQLVALDAPARFDLGIASVQTRLALLHTDRFADLSRRNQLAAMLGAALQKSGLTAPASVTAALPARGAVSPDVDSQIKQIQGDLISDRPPFGKDAEALAALATAQSSSPAALQAIAAAQARSRLQVVEHTAQSDYHWFWQ